MFLFPTVGHLLGMGPVQFGAWAGTGILNSAQVAGAALAFDPQRHRDAEGRRDLQHHPRAVPAASSCSGWPPGTSSTKWARRRSIWARCCSPSSRCSCSASSCCSCCQRSAPSPRPATTRASTSAAEQIKEDKLLKGKETRAIEGELARLKEPAGAKALQDHFTAKAINIGQRHATPEDAHKALADLIANKKMTSRDQDTLLSATAKMKDFDAIAKSAIEKASKAAWHNSKAIAAFRDWLAWLFAFGLIGLGMQITMAALKQAGGKPLIIGGVVGTVKAVGSLIVVLLFVKEFI